MNALRVLTRRGVEIVYTEADERRRRATLRQCLERLVAGAFRFDESQIAFPSRGRANVARARQVAMYLAHTICGYTLTDVGEMFERDRTTVAHACRVVEDQRDDPHFDRALDLLERGVRIIQIQAVGHAQPGCGGRR